MKEWHRTVVLVLLLAFAVATILWLQGLYQTNFTDTL